MEILEELDKCMKKKFYYSKPKLRTTSAKPSAACVDGSAAAGSGWTCVVGPSIDLECDTGNCAVLENAETCMNGTSAVGVDESCADGNGAVDSASGDACIAGGGGT